MNRKLLKFIPLMFAFAFMLGLLSVSSVFAGGPDDDGSGGSSGCVIPDSGPWPPCATGGDSSNVGDCVIPTSGPWPPCATGGNGSSSGNAGNTGDMGDCVIPASGPWPPCATDGSGGGSGNAGNTGNMGDCVIPASGPWPPCATDGSGGGSGNAGNTGDMGDCVIPESGPWPPCATSGGSNATQEPETDIIYYTSDPNEILGEFPIKDFNSRDIYNNMLIVRNGLQAMQGAIDGASNGDAASCNAYVAAYDSIKRSGVLYRDETIPAEWNDVDGRYLVTFIVSLDRTRPAYLSCKEAGRVDDFNASLVHQIIGPAISFIEVAINSAESMLGINS